MNRQHQPNWLTQPSKLWGWLSLFILTTVCSICWAFWPASSNEPHYVLPEPQPHTLPLQLQQWQAGDDNYFDAVTPTAAGYLVWSKFPVKIYWPQPTDTNTSASAKRFEQWYSAIAAAVAEWNVYLPLQQVLDPLQADIIIARQQVERQATVNPETGLFDLPRAATAQTRYQFYLTEEQPPTLQAKITITITPGQASNATLATARHELGHALGIWGHSEVQTDALYFSQVREPPPISARDINTLKQIYQQPTQLGWPLTIGDR